MSNAAKDFVRIGLELTDPIGRRVYSRLRNVETPLPPMALRARTGGRFVHRFVESGRRCARALEEAVLRETGHGVYDFDSWLDFGCGCGRTIMHWDRQRAGALIGCDVDAAGIDWLSGAFPDLTFRVNDFDPPLPFEDGQFGLVYSVSIFSHLCLADQRLWLEELRRVTRPGGIALITIQGEHARNRFPALLGATFLRQWDARDLDQERFVFLPYADFRPGEANTPGIKSESRDVTYGLAFISRKFAAGGWASGWEFLGLHEGTVDDLQDVAVLRNPGSDGSASTGQIR